LEEHAEALRAFRKLQVEVEQKLQDTARRTADTQKQSRALEKKHAQLFLHYVPDEPAPDTNNQAAVAKQEPDAMELEDAEKEEPAAESAREPADSSTVYTEPADGLPM